MEVFVMQLFNGISVSSIYLLAAIGLTITFGLMGVINMAHGEFLMIGAYTTYVIQNLFIKYLPERVFDGYIFIALMMSFLAAAGIGIILERTVISFLYNRPLDSLLVTYGISLFLQQLARTIFGAPNVSVKAPSFLDNSIKVTNMISFSYKRIAIMIIAVIAIAFVCYYMYKTRQGRNIRATVENRQMAACMGINTKRVDATTFALGCGLAGIAGCALTWLGAIGPALGTGYIVDTFMTVVIGGAGSIAGTIIGAAFIGIGRVVSEYYTTAILGQVIIFVCVIIVLQFRPKGLLSITSRALED